jgi:thioredoxin 1
MWRFLAQCPCDGGGGLRGEFTALAGVAGVVLFAKWVGFVRRQKGVSTMQKAVKIGIVVALLIAVGVVVAIKSRGSRSGVDSSVEPSVGVSTPDESEAGLPRLVDVGAGKCIPCKMMAPILNELKKEYAGRLRVDVYDVTDDPSAIDRFRVQLIPTQIFYDPAGGELWRHEGFISKEDILAKWEEFGIDLSVGVPTQPEDEGSDHEDQ